MYIQIMGCIKFHSLQVSMFCVCKYLLPYLQEIKKDNEGMGSRKIALCRTFLQCGMKIWEQVIKALEICDHDEIADQVKMKLLEYFSKVINVCTYVHLTITPSSALATCTLYNINYQPVLKLCAVLLILIF